MRTNRNPLSPQDTATLQACLQLVQDSETQTQAIEAYQLLRDRLLAQSSKEMVSAVGLLDLMWNALIASQRTAWSWQHMCEIEQELTDQMAESHVQLHQNYFRLIQEQ